MSLTTNRRALLGAAAAAPVWGALPLSAARAQAANTVRVGVLTDMSGLYRDINGPGTVACVRQAVADSGVAARGVTIEVVAGDHQNRPDVGANIARQWIDRDNVDVVVDVPTSSVALAISTICRERNKIFLASGPATSDLTGAQCSPNTIHWTYDTYMLAKSTGGALVRAGGDTWFFLTADYAFGHALERDTSSFVRAAGGRVVGAARTPFPSTDFSSFLVQAQASRAKVIGLANAGGDTINSIKQAAEFGLTRRGVKLAALLMFVNDVHSLGLQTAQGLVCSETFYWDLNDSTRRFTQRVLNAMPNQSRPSMTQAGCYSAVLHYAKTVADMGVARARASGVETVNRMKAAPTRDDAMGEGTIRPDGRRIQPSYLFEVKTPAESRGPWDYYKLLQTTPAEEAFRPVAEGGCAFLRT